MTRGTSTWEARFAAFTVNTFDVARDAPDRGIVVCGRLEPHQLHAWDRATGAERPD